MSIKHFQSSILQGYSNKFKRTFFFLKRTQAERKIKSLSYKCKNGWTPHNSGNKQSWIVVQSRPSAPPLSKFKFKMFYSFPPPRLIGYLIFYTKSRNCLRNTNCLLRAIPAEKTNCLDFRNMQPHHFTNTTEVAKHRKKKKKYTSN